MIYDIRFTHLLEKFTARVKRVRQFQIGNWKVADGKWQMADGRWQMMNREP
jgi:hypothetical protein